VTIAAGFVTREGILLCSDSQFTGWEKIYQSKLFSIPLPPFMVSFTFSGSGDHARSIIEDCYQELHGKPLGSAAIIRNLLRKTIKRGLAECPPECDKPEFLIGITAENEAHLFSARGGAMPRVERFEFLGSGTYIAHHVMKSLSPFTVDVMGFEQAAIIGLSVISAAKRNDACCGGGSQFLAASRCSGLILGPSSVERSDEHLDQYEYIMRNLFMSVGGRSEGDFERHLDFAVREIRRLRAAMIAPGSGFSGVLDSITQVGSGFRQGTTGDPQPPLPSQESPEGPNES
jgi:hypothetical protein